MRNKITATMSRLYLCSREMLKIEKKGLVNRTIFMKLLSRGKIVLTLILRFKATKSP